MLNKELNLTETLMEIKGNLPETKVVQNLQNVAKALELKCLRILHRAVEANLKSFETTLKVNSILLKIVLQQDEERLKNETDFNIKNLLVVNIDEKEVQFN